MTSNTVAANTATRSRRPAIAGNWKMFKTVSEATAFADELVTRLHSSVQADLPEIILCPPFTALPALQETRARLQTSITGSDQRNSCFDLAAQTMDEHEDGAYTGEISPVMLMDLGIQRVILGHSERRQYFNESNESVARKAAAAFRHGMIPIVCVGELLDERNNGQTDRVIEEQIRAVMSQIAVTDIPRMMVAYEPVWAIGTGKVCEPDEANRVCALIRQFLNEAGSDSSPGVQSRILYGGSVKPDNALQLMRESDIDGALIGGASLSVNSFVEVIQQVETVYAH